MKEYVDQYDDRATSDSYYLICPYCGCRDSEPYELSKDLEFTVETNCGRCGKEFLAHRSVWFTYRGCPKVIE